MAVEALAIALAVVLAIAATAAAYVGILGTFGAVDIVRCAHCGRLGLVRTHAPLLTCARCRHAAVMHPIHTLHLFATHAHRRW